MRSRVARSAWGLLLGASAFVAFAIAPVHAATVRDDHPNWGDIYSVIAGPGLTGGATQGDATLSVLFDGNGTANTVARSDHDHDGRYMLAGGTFDDRYALIDHGHDGVYLPVGTNFDDRYSLLAHNHDGLYLPVGANFDDRYLPLDANFDDQYS
ncbi:MAG: hypothetical protein ACRDKS_15350, partial [Actinomycetota bacterium]